MNLVLCTLFGKKKLIFNTSQIHTGYSKKYHSGYIFLNFKPLNIQQLNLLHQNYCYELKLLSRSGQRSQKFVTWHAQAVLYYEDLLYENTMPYIQPLKNHPIKNGSSLKLQCWA